MRTDIGDAFLIVIIFVLFFMFNFAVVRLVIVAATVAIPTPG